MHRKSNLPENPSDRRDKSIFRIKEGKNATIFFGHTIWDAGAKGGNTIQSNETSAFQRCHVIGEFYEKEGIYFVRTEV